MARRVLVVDDDWWVAELLQALLREAGYEVCAACDGEVALALIEQQPPDLVLSDVRMPRLDGPGLARRLRERGSLVPILLTSASVTAPTLADLPGVRFVPKPFAPDRLVVAVDEILASVQASRHVA